MKIIDQHSALIAQETALIPDSSLIDGRTEIDRLSFLTEFARVINFYDHNNTIQGNWSPFLLKDPAILLAHISKTRMDQINALFNNICTQIERTVNDDKIHGEMVIGMNNLFDELIELFVRIERWTYYMQLNAVEYELKKYIIHQVKITYSQYFYAILSLRDKLSVIRIRHRIKPVHYYKYDNFDQLTWKQQKDKSPYWVILGLDAAIDKNTKPVDVYNALKNAGNELILFLAAIVSFAAKAYPAVKALKGKYPDTLLIRTFVDLFGNYTTQLNKISNQHLQFYYQDILKQNLMPSIADQVLIFADLAKTDSTFMLPAGTLLNAGLDAQKKPIIFETIKDANLNPAKINSIYTIGKDKTTNTLTPIQQIINPSVIQKDEDGKVINWNLFGDTTKTTKIIPPNTPAVSYGFIIASPLLLLNEGDRIITITPIDIDISQLDLNTLTFYLSTADDWFVASQIRPTLDNSITITLAAKDPAIVPFLKNPELLDSVWPMLKIEFPEFNSLTKFSKLTSLNISVDVKNLKSVQLYNDFGTISSKNPYQPFGPTPLLNSNFIIGSNEIFSKPITSLQMEIDWNNLPDDFSTYYDIYNYYLQGTLDEIPLCLLFGLFKRKKIEQDPTVPTFNNQSFTMVSMVLQEDNWKYLNMASGVCPTHDPSALNDTNLDKLDAIDANYLFQETGTALNNSSIFHLGQFISNPNPIFADMTNADPQIQHDSAFKFTDKSTSGFMRISLNGIAHGFGSALYPNVVAQVATYNSRIIYRNWCNTVLMKAAKLPFSPKMSQLTFNYNASSKLNAKSTYPYQFLTYSTLGSTPFVHKSSVNVAETDPDNDKGPLQINDLLFSNDNKGFLFLEIENLIPSESISIYFELTIDHFMLSAPERKVIYYYLNENGWHLLAIVADETANFSCSGMISLAVPADISLQKFIGNDEKYWIGMVSVSESSSFPNIVMLKPNGLMAKRFSGGESMINLPIGSISQAKTIIPQIATITQPFPSFGGIIAEDTTGMNQRISRRIKTKDRTITHDNFYTLIKKNFNGVFYAKTIYDKTAKVNKVYVVPSAQNWQDPNAMLPLLNQCILDEVKDFLTERTSGLIPVEVTNFDLIEVKIKATIKVKSGYTLNGVMNNVNQALILFLSPWIAGSQPKITIDQELNPVDVSTFIQNIPGVVSVSDVSLGDLKIKDPMLIVSNAKHSLTCTY